MSTNRSGRACVRFGRRTRGFTLLEVVVVLAIVAIAATTAGLRLSSTLVRYRLDSAASRLVADMSAARQAAMNTSTPRGVLFTPATDTYTLASMHPVLRWTNRTNVRIADAPYSAKIDSANFGGAQQAVFDGYGSPVSAGTVVLRVGRSTRTVRVEATGAVSIDP